MESRAALRNTSAHVLLPPEAFDTGGALAIDDSTEHHLRRVLRLRSGGSVDHADVTERLVLLESAEALATPSADHDGPGWLGDGHDGAG